MNMLDIIIKKRNGGALLPEEIRFFVKGVTSGEIEDHQTAALLMAIYFVGMTDEETFELTSCLVESGAVANLRDIAGVKVDKHSSGGVGDKVTIAAVPIAAAAGVPIAKMSGRSLGDTGGTADKLESIPGFRTGLSDRELVGQVGKIGAAMITQTGDISPADKKLYVLRDVTGTVENKSLIAASIMSKKIASGSDAIVLDVKCGSGAFFKDKEQALAVAELMIKIGNAAGRKSVAFITDMNEPLGRAVGNANEVAEAIDVLKGRGPKDITEIVEAVSAAMIFVGEKAADMEEATAKVRELTASGRALAKLKEIIEYQGGDPAVTEDFSRLIEKRERYVVKAERAGYVSEVDAGIIGKAARHTGAGRFRKGDEIDHSAGIMLLKKIGEEVESGETVAEVFAKDAGLAEEAGRIAAEAFTVADEKPKERKIIIEKVGF